MSIKSKKKFKKILNRLIKSYSEIRPVHKGLVFHCNIDMFPNIKSYKMIKIERSEICPKRFVTLGASIYV